MKLHVLVMAPENEVGRDVPRHYNVLMGDVPPIRPTAFKQLLRYSQDVVDGDMNAFYAGLIREIRADGTLCWEHSLDEVVRQVRLVLRIPDDV